MHIYIPIFTDTQDSDKIEEAKGMAPNTYDENFIENLRYYVNPATDYAKTQTSDKDVEKIIKQIDQENHRNLFISKDNGYIVNLEECRKQKESTLKKIQQYIENVKKGEALTRYMLNRTIEAYDFVVVSYDGNVEYYKNNLINEYEEKALKDILLIPIGYIDLHY